MPHGEAGAGNGAQGIDHKDRKAQEDQPGLLGQRHQGDEADEEDVYQVDQHADANQQRLAPREALQEHRRKQLQQVGAEDEHGHQPHKGVIRPQQDHQAGEEVAANQVGGHIGGEVVKNQRAARLVAGLIARYLPAGADQLAHPRQDGLLACVPAL